MYDYIRVCIYVCSAGAAPDQVGLELLLAERDDRSQH